MPALQLGGATCGPTQHMALLDRSISGAWWVDCELVT